MEINKKAKVLYEDIINLGYNGNCSDKETFFEMFGDEPPNLLFINVTSWLSSQLAEFGDLENRISPVEDGEELDMKGLGFMVELSSLLKELNCPIKNLISGPLEGRMTKRLDQVNALMFLCSELQAAKILYLKKPAKPAQMKIELSESRTAKELKDMLIALNFGKPPDTIQSQQLFGQVEKKIKSLSQPGTPREFVKELLFTGCLTEKQWFQINDLYREMFQEYQTRRHLLITRLEVTIESFMWSDRLKVKVEEIRNMYSKLKKDLSDNPDVKISDILAASIDLTIIEKTSSGNVRKNTKSSVNKVMIGAVPDRGGRPEEQQPPPPEIPSWQKNDSSSRGGFKPSDKPRQSGNTYQMDGQRQYNSSNQPDRQRRDQQYAQGNSGYKSRDHDSYNKRDTEKNAPGYQNMYAGDYNSMHCTPPVMAHAMINTPIPPQFGFGGFAPAGDNFAQYGNYQPAPPRQRGHGGNYRGGRSRGNAPGRNRY